MNKRFECRSCADRQCAAECGETPKVCLRALIAEPDAAFPLWFPVGMSDGADKPDKSDRVPEWCEVENWCFQSRDDGDGKAGFGRIVEVGGAAMRVKYLTGRVEVVDLQPGRLMSFRPARVRPWTFREAPIHCKVIFLDMAVDEELFDVLRLESAMEGDEPATFYSDFYDRQIKPCDLIDPENRYLQLDGYPCGVLEVVNPA